jgi:hypothetical protein
MTGLVHDQVRADVLGLLLLLNLLIAWLRGVLMAWLGLLLTVIDLNGHLDSICWGTSVLGSRLFLPVCIQRWQVFPVLTGSLLNLVLWLSKIWEHPLKLLIAVLLRRHLNSELTLNLLLSVDIILWSIPLLWPIACSFGDLLSLTRTWMRTWLWLISLWSIAIGHRCDHHILDVLINRKVNSGSRNLDLLYKMRSLT